MNLYLILGFGLFLASLIISRIFSEKGLKVLSNEEKGMLISSFSKMRVTSIILLASIVFAYLVVMYSGAGDWLTQRNVPPTTLYFIFLFLYMVFSFSYTYKKQKELGLPDEYMKAQLKSNITRFIGILAMVIGLYKSIKPF
jgi:phosphatidylglycerophosphate synthase